MKFKKFYQLFEESNLDPNEQVALMHMYDRLQLSNNNPNFFDPDRQAYYIVFKRENLAKLMHVCEKTVTNTLRSLKDKNWIQVVKSGFAGANRIYLLKDIEKQDEQVTETASEQRSSHKRKIFPSYEQNVPRIKTKYINTKYKYTNSTELNTTYEQVRNASTQNHEHTNKSFAQHKSSHMDNLCNSLVEQGIKPSVVKTMRDYSYGNSNYLYNAKKMLFTAKKRAYKGYKSVVKPMRQFEQNSFINSELKRTIPDIMRNSYSADDVNAYFTSAFKQVIETAMDKYSVKHYGKNVMLEEQRAKFAKKRAKNLRSLPDIPMFKIGEPGFAF